MAKISARSKLEDLIKLDYSKVTKNDLMKVPGNIVAEYTAYLASELATTKTVVEGFKLDITNTIAESIQQEVSKQINLTMKDDITNLIESKLEEIKEQNQKEDDKVSQVILDVKEVHDQFVAINTIVTQQGVKIDNINNKIPAQNACFHPENTDTTSVSENECPIETPKYGLLVEKQGESSPITPESWANVLSKDLNEKLQTVPILKSTLTKSGKGYISFHDADTRDEAERLLQSSFDVQVSNKTRTKLYPKMKLCNIDYNRYKDKEHGRDTLRKSILAKNSTIASMVNDKQMLMDVLFVQEEELGYGFAIIKIDPQIRDLIIKNNRKLFLDMMSIHVKDQLHLTQCFVCQKFGHKKGSQYCEALNDNKSTCLYCSENHKSSECHVKRDPTKHNCANCQNSDNITIKRNSKGHTTTSQQCPIVQKETQLLAARTSGLNPKNYQFNRTIQMNRGHP